MAVLNIFVWILLGALSIQSLQPVSDPNIFSGSDGYVHFVSTAPQEQIEAFSHNLKGALDISDRSFFFSLKVVSFEGFNTDLQKEHFNESYLESSVFPAATFKGRIIEEIDFSQNQKTEVRAKGMLTIHGISVERIMTGVIEIENNMIELNTEFIIPLIDHDIAIPRIVEMKISREVKVNVSMVLTRNN